MYSKQRNLIPREKRNENVIRMHRTLATDVVLILYSFRYVRLMRSPCSINKAQKQKR